MGWRSLSGAQIVILGFLFGCLTYAATSSSIDSIRVPFCPRASFRDYILGTRDRICPAYGDPNDESPVYYRYVAVTEGDEQWLQMANDMIRKKNCEYVALLFHASWCPFSRSFRPSYDIMSSLYTSIPHFAVEKSTVRPSLLSKYGVHGFPTLLLINSTIRARYHGSRSLGSLVAFYSDITGLKTLDETLLDKSEIVPYPDKRHNTTDATDQESCPFSWARSPENMFCQETYLILATAFVLLRFLYLSSPYLLASAKLIWTRLAQNAPNLLEHPFAFLSRLVQLCGYLKEPCKRSNLQEGPINEFLATVSIGDSRAFNGFVWKSRKDVRRCRTSDSETNMCWTLNTQKNVL